MALKARADRVFQKKLDFNQKLTFSKIDQAYSRNHTRKHTHEQTNMDSNKFSAEQIAALRQEIAELRKENQEMKKRTHIPLKLEVTERNQVAVIFNKYHCRLYKTQWLKILDQHQELREFIEDNAALLD